MPKWNQVSEASDDTRMTPCGDIYRYKGRFLLLDGGGIRKYNKPLLQQPIEIVCQEERNLSEVATRPGRTLEHPPTPLSTSHNAKEDCPLEQSSDIDWTSATSKVGPFRLEEIIKLEERQLDRVAKLRTICSRREPSVDTEHNLWECVPRRAAKGQCPEDHTAGAQSGTSSARQYFDIVAGTSTGGLIAIMLGRLSMPVADCLCEYQTLRTMMFSEREALRKESGRWSQDITNRLLRTERTLSWWMRDLLRPSVEASTSPSLGVSAADGAAILDYVPSGTSSNLPVWQVARAITAAPTYFDPLFSQSVTNDRRRKFRHADGAPLGQNNPAIGGVERFYELHSPHSLGTISSIGTAQRSFQWSAVRRLRGRLASSFIKFVSNLTLLRSHSKALRAERGKSFSAMLSLSLLSSRVAAHPSWYPSLDDNTLEAGDNPQLALSTQNLQPWLCSVMDKASAAFTFCRFSQCAEHNTAVAVGSALVFGTGAFLLHRCSPNGPRKDLALTIGLLTGCAIGISKGLRVLDVLLQVLPVILLLAMVSYHVYERVNCCRKVSWLEKTAERDYLRCANCGNTGCSDKCSRQ
ncbi:MAG: hypothetical protein M1822_004457 [Bathelium mastoideum]|nr:MAG: hypothetical protein M1822_004457 [Bathelium mastoideum]